MTAPRSVKENLAYYKYRRQNKGADCVFCQLSKDSAQVVSTHKHFKIVTNRFPYSLWDSQKVADHLMIVPIRHTDTISHFNAAEIKEFMKLMGQYEKDGYNIYARAPGSAIKTVVHQHTHLIKPKGRAGRVLFLLRKPFYIRLGF